MEIFRILIPLFYIICMTHSILKEKKALETFLQGLKNFFLLTTTVIIAVFIINYFIS